MKERPKTQCPECGQWIANSGFQRHLNSHIKGTFGSNQPKNKLDHDDPYCKYCGKEYQDRGLLLQHEIRCPKNPNKLPDYLSIARSHINRTHAWNEGLTAETDERVAKQAETQRKTKRSKYPVTALSAKLDDDGKLYQKYRSRVTISKHFPNKCLLTFDEFCQLMDDAGIKSSDLGYTGTNWDLARYGDQGNYTFDNCRFITHAENLRERRPSQKAIEASRKSGEARRGKLLFKDEAARENYLRKLHESEYYKKRHVQALINQANRPPIDTHNSQCGSHWITNGSINKKWRPDSGDPIPEGFYLGRVISCKNKDASVV